MLTVPLIDSASYLDSNNHWAFDDMFTQINFAIDEKYDSLVITESQVDNAAYLFRYMACLGCQSYNSDDETCNVNSQRVEDYILEKDNQCPNYVWGKSVGPGRQRFD